MRHFTAAVSMNKIVNDSNGMLDQLKLPRLFKEQPGTPAILFLFGNREIPVTLYLKNNDGFSPQLEMNQQFRGLDLIWALGLFDTHSSDPVWENFNNHIIDVAFQMGVYEEPVTY